MDAIFNSISSSTVAVSSTHITSPSLTVSPTSTKTSLTGSLRVEYTYSGSEHSTVPSATTVLEKSFSSSTMVSSAAGAVPHPPKRQAVVKAVITPAHPLFKFLFLIIYLPSFERLFISLSPILFYPYALILQSQLLNNP